MAKIEKLVHAYTSCITQSRWKAKLKKEIHFIFQKRNSDNQDQAQPHMYIFQMMLTTPMSQIYI